VTTIRFYVDASALVRLCLDENDGADVTAALVYDHRLRAAMSDAGLAVLAPGS